MTIDLPPTVKRGQSFSIVVRQITSSASKQAPPPPPNQPPGRIGARGKAAPRASASSSFHGQSRHTIGAFQIQIPVRTKTAMLEPEERNLSVLRWIQQTIPNENRWYPVFERYVDVIADRVNALGGDATTILPSPDGSGVHPTKQPGHHPEPVRHHPEPRVEFVGKVDGLVYDRFGDFAGFVLETDDGRHHFECRESELEAVLTRAWSQRVRTTIVVDKDAMERPVEVILFAPPPPWRG
jgi:hypothetical protein